MSYSFRIYVNSEEVESKEVLEKFIKESCIKMSDIVFLNDSGRVFEINQVCWIEAFEISQCLRRWFKYTMYLPMEDNRFVVEI